VLAIAAMGALTGCGDWSEQLGETRHENHAIALDKSELVRVNLKMGVGELMVASGTSKLMEGEYSWDFASGEPVIDYRPGAPADLTISQRGGGHASNGKCTWEIKLSESVPLEVEAKLGVGEAHLDFGKLDLRRLDINMGVGELMLDLKGTPKRSYDVRIHG